MSWGFEPGRVYNRRLDIHAKFGGQQQGGIITPSAYSAVIIVTGEEGLAHGYQDRERADGIFEYFGEGQVGDMVLARGNLAIAEHSANGKSLLLFRKVKDGLRFVNEMVYETHHNEPAPDRTGANRNAIIFELRPLESIVQALEAEQIESRLPASLDQLRAAAMIAGSAPDKGGQRTTKNVYERSHAVRTYVLARANGKCEACDAPAPFIRADGTPYLEPHHIRRRSDGGPDHPAFVIATCPTCHRRVHFGVDGKNYNDALLAKMRSIESQ